MVGLEYASDQKAYGSLLEKMNSETFREFSRILTILKQRLFEKHFEQRKNLLAIHFGEKRKFAAKQEANEGLLYDNHCHRLEVLWGLGLKEIEKLDKDIIKDTKLKALDSK
eukprot:Pgem_evm1s10975